MARKKRILPPPPRKDGAKEVIVANKVEDRSEHNIPITPPQITTADADFYAKNRVPDQHGNEELSKSVSLPFDPPAAESVSVEENRGDFQHIPRDLAFLAADKAKKTASTRVPKKAVPAPPIFQGEKEVKKKYPAIKRELPSPPVISAVPVPKPSSLKLPSRPKFVDDELDGGLETSQKTPGEVVNQQVLPSLPDINTLSKLSTPRKRRKMTVDSGSFDYSQVGQQEKQPVDNLLVNEVKNIFQKGIKESLVSVDKNEIDYIAHDRDAERKRYLRMKDDYEAAGKKFLEINLHVNTAHSYSLALVSQYIADGISSALGLLEEYVKILPKIVLKNEIFQLIMGLLGAVKAKDRKQVSMAEDILQKVSFLSIEDKELARKCIRVINASRF